ncbi:hypothetical protein [Mucisphaera sp.]|uniref:hypothetical protein n=1 Tax=Mucisphaera sp. TaxID=2913024 RepID=UPI003D0C5EAF
MTGVELEAIFAPAAADDALDFNFIGIQDNGPVTQTLVQDARLILLEGFDYGPGTLARSQGPDGLTATDQGDEFNAGGFDTGSLSAAIVADDYLGFTVQAADGFELLIESISFDLWRNGFNAANDYAILTSLEGFTEGQALAQRNNVASSGPGSRQTFTAFSPSGSTSEPVDIRLYGWNANDGLASTHIQAVSMDATFILAGEADAPSPAPGDAYGLIELDGSYIQREQAVLRLDLGADGRSDRLLITGDASLDGVLLLSIDEPDLLTLGTAWRLLEVGGLIQGAFAGLDQGHVFELDGHWVKIRYGSDVELEVVPEAARADFNDDRRVDLIDLSILASSFGENQVGFVAGDASGDEAVDLVDLSIRALAFGETWESGSSPVPEPAGGLALLVGFGALRLRLKQPQV